MSKLSSVKTLLASLGFTKNQTSIYLVLTKKGALKAGEIISLTGLPRSVVYTCLQDLASQGLLIKNTKQGVAIFTTLDPEALVIECKRKLKDAEEVANILQQERGILEKEAYVYEGDDIVTTIAKRSLETPPGSTVYFFGSSKFGAQANLEQFWKKYHQDREGKQIRCKILYDRFTPAETLSERNKYTGCEARYLPIDTEIPMSFNIWEDHVAILLPGNQPPISFIIRSQSTADALIEYFNYLWRHSKKN